ncbi:MAG TPA: hydantoinase B/oxoprolinase family protein [Burkholderiales bacterium]|jgi:N-methylhydantoinase B|nr:hydantoinase B/oxoprolinase family protein [Burkholderiales bacterium]
MSTKLDPITLEILWRRLISIVDEADAAVARTAFSSLLRDAHDYTCMFTDSRGRELAQGTLATPGQSGAMALGIKKLVQGLPPGSFRDGDVYITNDPWALAGHLNDVCVLSPIFHRGRLAAFTACILHHSDIGGRVASDNREVFEEGLFIPLVKLYDAGQLNQGVLDMIRANVRTPEQVNGDIRSQIAANHVCAEQIVRMLEEYGLPDLDGLGAEIIARSERSIREAIAKVPPGVYRAEAAIEQVAGQPEVRIRCAVTIAGSDITVDLTGSSPQVDWGGNVVYNFTYAYVHMAVKSVFDPEIPNNDGIAAPIRLIAPEGSVVNCRHPAAVAARMQIGHFVTEVIYRALAEALPERVVAAGGGTPATMQMFYGRRGDGRPFHAVMIRGGGLGAGARRDGEGSFIFPANGANTPVEILESDAPLLVERRELLPDTGGAGKQRGALGRREVFRVPDDEQAPQPPVLMALQSGRFQLPPAGLFGGKPGARAQFLVNGTPGDPYGLTPLKPGDTVVMDAAGGGGYGDPRQRDPDAVARDLKEGKVSAESARRDYGAAAAVTRD